MAISFTPGQVVSWDDFNALLAQHGSPQGAKSVEVLPMPKMSQDEIDAYEDAHDGESPSVGYQRNPTRRYHFQDGTFIEAQMDENASTEEWTAGRAPLRIVKYAPSQVYQQAQTKAAAADPANQTPQQKNEAALNDERSWNADPANIPAGASGFRDTHEEAAARKKKAADEAAAAAQGKNDVPVGTKQTTDAQGKTVKVTTMKRPDGSTYDREDSSQAAPEEPKVGTTTFERNGQTYTRITSLSPDGKTFSVRSFGPDGKEVAEIPAEVKQPTIRQGQEGRPDIQYVPDKNNPGQVIAVPIQGTGTSTVALPEGFARPQFSPMQVSAVLGQTQQKLDTWVQGATDENDRRARMQKATELMAQAHQEATTYLNEQQIGTTAARDVYGNQISERGQTISRQNQLTSSGAGMANQAVGTLLPLLRYAQAGSGDAAKALVQLMGVMQQSVGDMGGLGAAPANIGVPGILGPYMQGGAGAPAAAPGVSPANAPGTSAGVTTPGGPGGPAPAGASAAPRSYDPNQWDQGPNGTLVPRQRTPGSSAAPAAGAPVPDAAATQMAQQQQAAAQAAAAAVPAAPAAQPAVPAAPPAPTAAPGYGDPGFYRPAMQGSTPTDPGFFPPGMQGPDTTDPGFFPPGMQGAPQGMQGDGGMPPLAVMQALLQHVEPMMQADPNWGVNDLAEIQLGRSPWG